MTHFIDWISIKQRHPEPGLPVVSDGYIIATDAECGKLHWESLQHHKVEGSHDTALRLRCDGQEVMLSGNVGRFGRPDNIFNLDWQQTIDKANSILAAYGLPPFTPGERTFNKKPSAYDIQEGITSEWSGATVSRIDVTRNYACGSRHDARAVIEWLDGQTVTHIKKHRAGATTVQHGSKEGRRLVKFYIKAAEMLAHAKNGRAAMEQSPFYQYAEETGLLRAELEAHRLLLRSENMRYLGDITMPKIIQLYEKNTEVLQRLSRVQLQGTSFEITSLPARVRMTAQLYFDGKNVRELMNERTWYRHAKTLRDYGIDIAEPRNVSSFPVSVRVLDICPATPPHWYWEASQFTEYQKAA